MSKEAIAYLKKYCLNQDSVACICDEVMLGKNSNVALSPAGRILKVVLMEKDESDWSASTNAFMINEGLALLGESTIKQIGTKNDMPEEAQAWIEFQDEARDAKVGIWALDGKIESIEDISNDDY